MKADHLRRVDGGSMRLFAAAWAILLKDIRNEARAPKVVAPMFLFAFIVLLVFVFAIDPLNMDVLPVFPGILWTGVFFAGAIGMARMFSGEMSRGSLQGLVAAPIDRAAIYFGKFGGGLVFVGLTVGTMTPLLFLFFRQNITGPWWQLASVLLLVNVGFVAVGTLVAAITAQTGQSEVLLPILLFPLSIPLVLGAVELTAGLLENGSFADNAHWIWLLAFYDLLFIVLGPLLFDYVVEVS